MWEEVGGGGEGWRDGGWGEGESLEGEEKGVSCIGFLLDFNSKWEIY